MGAIKFQHVPAKVEKIMSLPDEKLVSRIHIIKALGMIPSGQLERELKKFFGVSEPAQRVSRFVFYYAKDAKAFIQRRLDMAAADAARAAGQTSLLTPPDRVAQLEERLSDLKSTFGRELAAQEEKYTKLLQRVKELSESLGEKWEPLT